MSFDLSLHVHYLERGLLTAHEFCTLQSLDYYRDEYQRGKLARVPSREITKRASRCNACGEFAPRGAPNFWSRSIGWVHFCRDCSCKIGSDHPTNDYLDQ